MKTALDKVTKEKAPKELKTFLIWGAALSGVGLFVFSFLGIAGIAFSARALLLTFHEANRNDAKVMWRRVLAVAAILVGVLDVIAMGAK